MEEKGEWVKGVWPLSHSSNRVETLLQRFIFCLLLSYTGVNADCYLSKPSGKLAAVWVNLFTILSSSSSVKTIHPHHCCFLMWTLKSMQPATDMHISGSGPFAKLGPFPNTILVVLHRQTYAACLSMVLKPTESLFCDQPCL